MNISPTEAEEALASIQNMTHKTRRSIADSGAHVSLIVTGVVWLIGFTCTQFLSGEVLVYIWIALSVIGSSVGYHRWACGGASVSAAHRQALRQSALASSGCSWRCTAWLPSRSPGLWMASS